VPASADTGVLFVVSTPIGNLGDLSPRAVETLAHCAVVLAEDTRRTRTLLTHAGIRARLESLREHNEARVTTRALSMLRDGRDIALVSDAGTPLVADPGERLVAAAASAGIRVTPVPGPSAVLAALSVAGLPVVPFTFLGFVPRSGRERAEFLQAISTLHHTAVCYESPDRLADTLAAWVEHGLGERRVVTARELTKRFEEVRRGTVRELAAYHQAVPPRGEVVIVLGGAAEPALDEAGLASLAQAWRGEGLPAREVARRLSDEHGVPRNLAYRLAHE
jgi:16S rRNA (cytidine1402-2'-O)-methyltransferase